MYRYTVSQWILFFFWYCFLGWIWESCYVSIKKAVDNRKWKWVNRGFLNGPALPIYGFAAISILIVTINIRGNVGLVFLMGGLAATGMELVTGSTMEKLFHVKYWDYSNIPLNYKGHICFFVSLFWGVLSIFLVEVIHVPVEEILLQCPKVGTEVAAFVLIGAFMYDFNDSLRAALDMKELLEKLTESRIVIERLENRVDAVLAFAGIPDITEIKELPKNRKEQIMYRLEKRRERRVTRLEQLKAHIASMNAEELKDKEEIMEQLEKQIREVFKRTNQQFYRAAKHVKHNPTAISKKYKEAFEELKELLEEKR